MEIKIHMQRTALFDFMVWFWVIGLLMLPFLRFMPRKWLVKPIAIPVDQGSAEHAAQ